MTDERPQPEATSGDAPTEVSMQKVYVKKFALKSPRAPAVFTTRVSPQIEVGVRSGTQNLGPNTYEVTLNLTATATDQGAACFVAEVAQAAVFVIQGFSAEQRAVVTGSVCPSILYPYAREAIAHFVAKGGFPQLLLQPVNFDALYAESTRLAREKANSPPAV
jgi:preprotein translocase subunit SecB